MEEKKCSFCGLNYSDELLINGMSACICGNCIESLIEEKTFVDFNKNKDTLLKPHLIKMELDKYVIGQDTAKKKIAVEVCNHYKRIGFKSKSIQLPKNNILLLGPTGSGKTYILETLSKILDVPLAIGDATGLTEAGYVGKDVDTLLQQLIEKSDGDIKKAERGIIYIDEIDKIASSGGNDKDVAGEGVQSSLLKIIEGMDYTFPKTGQTINTNNILFVCGGAFDGLTKIIQKRLTKKAKIGFKSSSGTGKFDISPELLHKVTVDDLSEFGLIREFTGRLHLIATLDDLSTKELRDVLTKPKNALIKQYKALLKLDGIKLNFDKDALDYISIEAKLMGTGARGLKSVLSDKLNDLLYELPLQQEKSTIIEYDVTKEYLCK